MKGAENFEGRIRFSKEDDVIRRFGENEDDKL